jgi:pheromone shutdown protein TraB
MLEKKTTQDVGRIRMAAWEVRNLRMVANIREAMARHPGGRVLVIVGAGHKPWFEAYLALLPDIRLVDAQTILR